MRRVMSSGFIVFILLAFPLAHLGTWGLDRAWGQDTEQAVLEVKGYLLPSAVIQVTPRVSGQVTELHFEEGALVEKGAVLARIDSTPYELDYKRAVALLAVARARLEEATAKSMEAHHKERVEIAKAELAVADAECAKAKWLLDGTAVRAPISGTILAKSAEKGNVINVQSLTQKSTLCDLADLTHMEVDVMLQERDFRKVFKGQKCKIQVDAFPDVTYKGEVLRILPIADRARGAIPVRVRIEVPKGDTKPRPEMSALVTFLGRV